MTSTFTSNEPGLTIILDTSELAENLMVTVERFEKKHLKGVTSHLTNDQAFAIVHAIVDDVLNQRMRWAKDSVLQLHAVELHMEWTSKPSLRKHLDRFDSEVLDAYDMTIHARLDQFMERFTWDIWSTRVIGRDIVLVKGIDFRIYDWERRMANGEWQNEVVHS